MSVKKLILLLFAVSAFCFASDEDQDNTGADPSLTAGLILDDKLFSLQLTLLNVSKSTFRIHMDTVARDEQSWIIRGFSGKAEQDGHSPPVYANEMSMADPKTDQNFPAVTDRSVDLKPGEGIGVSVKLMESPLWEDIIVKGIPVSERFTVSSKLTVYTADQDGNPVKTDIRLVSNSVGISRQTVLELEGARLEKELRSPPSETPRDKPADTADTSIIYKPSNQKKVYVGSYLNRETGLFTFTVQNITAQPLSLHIKMLEKPQRHVNIFGYIPDKDVDIDEYFFFMGGGEHRSWRIKKAELDRTVILKPGEMIVNSIYIWKCNFWDDLSMRGIDPEMKRVFNFNLITSVFIADQTGKYAIDKAETDYNKIEIDCNAVLRLQKLKKKLESEKQPPEKTDK